MGGEAKQVPGNKAKSSLYRPQGDIERDSLTYSSQERESPTPTHAVYFSVHSCSVPHMGLQEYAEFVEMEKEGSEKTSLA